MKANRREKAGPIARTESAGRIEASEVRYRRLFESSRDGILILDAKTGMVVDVNPFLIELLGYSHETFLGKKVWELGFFTDIVANQDTFAELQQKEYVRYEDMPLETADGRRIDVEFISSVYLVNDQKVVQCSIRDITERKRTADALRESEGRFRSYVESANDIIYTLSPKGILTYVSPNWEVALGHDVRDVIGQSFTHFVHPDDVPACRAFLEQALAAGAGAGRIEYRVQHNDGTWRWHSSSGSSLVDDDGTLNSYMGIARDITERKQAERTLKVKDAAVESAITAMAISDLAGSLTYVNPAFVRLWGCESVAEVLGRSLAEFSQSPEKAMAIAEAVRAHGGWVGDQIMRRPDGRPLEVRMAANLVADAAGQPICMLASFEDITERKRAEDELRRDGEMLARTEGVAHIGSWEWEIATDTVTWSDELFRIFQREPREGAPSFAEHPTLYPPEDMARLRQAVEAAVAEGTPYALDLRAIRKDGTTRRCVARGHAAMAQSGRAVRLFGSLQDITERKLAEETIKGQLDELERWRGVMLDREDRVREIKREVNELLRRLGEPIRYPSQEDAEPGHTKRKD